MADKTLSRNDQICLVASCAKAVTDGYGRAAAVSLVAAINHARMGEIRRVLFLEMVDQYWDQIEAEEDAARSKAKHG